MTIEQTYAYRPTKAGPFNAWFFDRFDRLLHHYWRPLKDDLFVDVPSTVVEIGPGVGANFRYYPPGTSVVAIEPNPAMHDRLAANAARHDLRVHIQPEMAEATSLDADSAELVVSTLVLCTVADPVAAVVEIHRVLRPGGRFLFLEHVRGQGRILRSIQYAAAGPWRTLFEGCELNRDTLDTVRRAGFRVINADERTLATPFVPVNAMVAGKAVK